jgi:lipoate-protein ligase A
LKEGTARQKVPGGKLLIVKLKYDNKIAELQIIGDFFVFPEDALPEIESALVGMNVGEEAEIFSKKIRNVAEHNSIELIGITPDAIAQTIKMAIK